MMRKTGRFILTWSLLILMICFCVRATAEETSFTKIEPFSEGLAAVCNEKRQWGYIDITGKVVIPCEWDDAGEFSEGFASVRKGSKLGCVSSSGELVIPCEWDGYSLISYSEELASVQNDEGLWGFIDRTGTIVIPCYWEGGQAPFFSEGFAAVKKDGLTGYINKAGELVIPCQYWYCEKFVHGYAIVQDEEGFFFIDTTGAVAFPGIPHADQAGSFTGDGIAHLELKDYTDIFIDTDGRTVLTLSDEYRIRSGFSEGLAGVAKQNEQGEWEGCEGYIDKTGSVIIPLELHSSFYPFRNGRTSVPDGPVIVGGNTHYGIIDHSGVLIYPFTLDKAVQFEDTVAVAVQDGKAGAIDISGHVIVPFVYDDVKAGDGIILCLKEGKLNLFDYSGKELK